MQEVHIVLLYQRELPATPEHIAVFKSALDADEEVMPDSPELRSETETEHTVLVTGEAMLIDDAAVPIVAFPEIVAGRSLPVVAHLPEDFHGIAVGQRMLVADGSVERRGEQEAGIHRQLSFLRVCAARDDGAGYQ